MPSVPPQPDYPMASRMDSEYATSDIMVMDKPKSAVEQRKVGDIPGPASVAQLSRSRSAGIRMTIPHKPPYSPISVHKTGYDHLARIFATSPQLPPSQCQCNLKDLPIYSLTECSESYKSSYSTIAECGDGPNRYAMNDNLIGDATHSSKIAVSPGPSPAFNNNSHRKWDSRFTLYPKSKRSKVAVEWAFPKLLSQHSHSHRLSL